MKKISKMLVLLLAVLFTVTGVIACDGESTGDTSSGSGNESSSISGGDNSSISDGEDSSSGGNDSSSGGEEVVVRNYKDLTYNSNSDYAEGSNLSTYDTDLFRRNEYHLSTKEYSSTIADPSVLYVDDKNREDYGTFYLYYTTVYAKNTNCRRSKDMQNWEPTDCILSKNVIDSGCLNDEVYAPHVIRDGDKYYMFISGKPNGAPSNMPFNFVYLLSSDNPYGPFDFVDVDGKNRAKSYKDKNGNDVYCGDYWAEYMYFDTAQYAKRVIELEKEIGNDYLYKNYNFNGYFSNIDPYAFIDDDGTRYVYFVFRSYGYRYLAGVRCGDSFADVDYSSLNLITLGGHMDVQGTTKCEYQSSSTIDEGPNMLKHNGKYYLTYSFGSLTTTYQVGQAVSDNPLSGFRKLELSENGILLSDDRGNSAGFVFTNPGGHDIVTVNGKQYIVYHRNTSQTPSSSPYTRVFGADELKWVTIKDKNGKALDVMYANGPTVTIQPQFEFLSEYNNIASQATVTATNLLSSSSAVYLTDGLLSMYKVASLGFNNSYVKETTFQAKTTITMTFPEYVAVKGLMIYNSKQLTRAFSGVDRVEFDCIDENGEEVTWVISDLKVDWKASRHEYSSKSLKNASAAIASFDELTCKEIRIQIDVPSGGWSVDEEGNLTFDGTNTFKHAKTASVSEIVVLGKKMENNKQ